VTDFVDKRVPWLCVGLLLIGHFAPWAAHRTAALTLSAHELAVFTNYTPFAGVFPNEGFLLPLWAAAMLVAGLGTRRWPALLAALGILLLGLPGYPELRRMLDGQPSEFLPQLVLCAAFGALSIGVWWGAAQQARWAALLLCALTAVLCAVALTGFLVIRGPALENLYKDAVGLGWGWWGTLAASVGLALSGFVKIWPALSFPRRRFVAPRR
jgi:hypothetical protein